MTLLQRAATLAAMAFSLVTLGTSTSGQAADIAQPAVHTIWGPNVPIVQAVPDRSAETTISDPTDDEDFDSLAQAVSAQAADTDDESLHCLAGAVFFESKGEPLTGQLAVAEVIINRTKSGRFPEDLCAVVKQHGQFGFVRGGEIPAVNTASSAWHTAVAVAKVALAKAWDSPATNALFFNASGHAPGSGLTRIAAIGNHFFYR